MFLSVCHQNNKRYFKQNCIILKTYNFEDLYNDVFKFFYNLDTNVIKSICKRY